jgi:CBS domain-containing protein
LIQIKADSVETHIEEQRGDRAMNAADVMMSNVITVSADAGVRDVAKILVANRISAVPVVDNQGKLVGIISEGDLIRRPEIGSEKPRSWWLDALSTNGALADEFVRSHSRKVSDVMTRDVVTAKPDESLSQIAALLEKNRIKRVPIVSEEKIVGIVSRANLVQALASLVEKRAERTAAGDAELRGKVFARLQQAPRTSRSLPNVFVHDGTVQLWGAVDTEAERKVVRVAAEATPGVRCVIDNLVVHPG